MQTVNHHKRNEHWLQPNPLNQKSDSSLPSLRGMNNHESAESPAIYFQRYVVFWPSPGRVAIFSLLWEFRMIQTDRTEGKRANGKWRKPSGISDQVQTQPPSEMTPELSDDDILVDTLQGANLSV
jgi:hypothetical protein